MCIECQKLRFLRNKSWDGGLGMSSEIEYTVTVCSALVQPAYGYSQLVGNAH